MNSIDITVIILFIIILATFGYFKLKNSLVDNDNINDRVKEILNKPESEPFIVADAQDFHNYDKLKSEVLKESDKFDDKPVKQNNDKCNDTEDDFSVMVVNNALPQLPPLSKPEKRAMCPNDFGWDPSYPVMSCSNSSIANSCKTIPQRVLPYPISCQCPNILTGENYYKSHLYGQCAKVKVDDYYVKGANYPEYSDYISPEKSNIRILSQNTKGLPPDQMKYRNIPQGSNYVFDHWTQNISGPVMRLP